MLAKLFASTAPVIAASVFSASAGATLIFEPVISVWTGPSDNIYPLYDPTFVNMATGEQVSVARAPGEIDKWSQGFPREVGMVSSAMQNNTAYNITSLTMTIVGSSVELIPGASWVVTPDPNVDAFFGDVNDDGRVGLSDIFSTITVSNGGRTLTLSGGLLPAGSLFSDYIFSKTTDGANPVYAALEGSFDGVLAPEPATWTLLPAGLGAIWARRRRSGTSR